jgi:hypothetical protein
MQFQSHYNRFLLSLEGTKNIYVSFCENIISFCAPRTFRFADYRTGILQVIEPIESEIVARGEQVIEKVRSSKSYPVKEIDAYYKWVDEFVQSEYKEKFGI